MEISAEKTKTDDSAKCIQREIRSWEWLHASDTLELLLLMMALNLLFFQAQILGVSIFCFLGHTDHDP